MTTTTELRFCAGETPRGRCRNRVRRGSDYCVSHDPALTPEERAWLRQPITTALRAERARRRLEEGS